MPRYEIGCANGHEMLVFRTIATRHDPCPECGAAVEMIWRGKAPHAVGDDIPGGMVIENGVPKPVKVYSHSEAARIRAKHGCELRPFWVPGDKHLTRWDSVDLDAAKALVSRVSKGGGKEPPRPPEALVRELHLALNT